MKPLCVIPARRGSKRLPLKNILPLFGKPMIVYTIKAAIDSGIFDEVYVSSEDTQIREIALACGAAILERPLELADDLVSATDVCIDAYEKLASKGAQYDAVVCLQPTAPLRNSHDIAGAWKTFCDASADYLVSVTPIDPHYFHWAVAEGKDGWAMYFGEEFMKERLLLPPVYRPNGAIKIGTYPALIARRNFFGPNLVVYEMPEERSLHVAELYDYKIAQFLLENKSN